jgi:hypothetical protein
MGFCGTGRFSYDQNGNYSAQNSNSVSQVMGSFLKARPVLSHAKKESYERTDRNDRGSGSDLGKWDRPKFATANPSYGGHAKLGGSV